MTLEEAIKGIKEVLGLDCHIKYPEWIEALNLGIEALKCIKKLEVDHPCCFEGILTGETKE